MSEPALSPAPLVPPLALSACIACVAGAGALANCSVLTALLKSTRNGLCLIIIQIIMADFIIIGTTALPELWYYNTRTWKLGYSACVAYRGLNVFASTVLTYLIATIAFHTIATVNVEEKAMEKRLKRNDTAEDEEMGSSHHSLVANSDSSTPRTMNVDYRLMDRRVAVTPPSVFVWILAASLSVPEFTLATTVHLNQNVILCTAVDSHHKFNMHSLLAAFNLFLPTALMAIAATLVIFKLKSKNLPDLDVCKSTTALKLSLWMILVYSGFSAPRSIAAMYNVYSRSTDGDEASSFEMDQVDDTMALVRLGLSSAFLAASSIRPLLYLILLPRVRKVFSIGPKTMGKV